MIETHANTPAAALELRLFGTFQVRLHGAHLPHPRTRKEQWLLALLALRHGQPVPRSWLAGTLWPESAEEQALYNLRRNLSELRSTLGSEAWRLHPVSPRSLQLDLSGVPCDLLTFGECIHRGDPASLEGAVALYRGPLLEGWTEEWVLPERTAREGEYLQALETLAGYHLARGEYSKAATYLRRVLAVDPLRESAHRRLMEVLAAAGDHTAAKQVYRDLRLLLHREINAAPSRETTVLFERIKAEVAVKPTATIPPTFSGQLREVPAGAPAPLPQPLNNLVGRNQDIRDLRARLESARLVTLAGTGGVGKTRLAVQVGSEAATSFTDGACFVDLTAIADAALVPNAVLVAVGVPEEAGRPAIATLLEFLRPRSLLLLLDNCEHLIDECARLAHALLVGCPHLRIIATSREPLNVPGETVWRVPSLTLPAAERLFIERGQQARADFAPVPSAREAISRICRSLDGIPLAIELAAARLKAMSAEQIAERLDHQLSLLASGSRTAPPRQQTLRAALEWSYTLLPESERRLLRRLSVFAGGWSLEAAEATCADYEIDEPEAELPAGDEPPQALSGSGEPLYKISSGEVLDLLSGLVERSLVVYEESDGRPRYRLLEMVRQFACECLGEYGETNRIRRRHAACFRQLAVETRLRVFGAEQAASLRLLEREHDNIRAALDWHHAQEPAELELEFAGALGPFWQIRGHAAEGRRRLEAALGRSEAAAPSQARAVALRCLGDVANQQGDGETARRCCEESLVLSRQFDQQLGIASCLIGLGVGARERGEYAVAHELLEESLEIMRVLGDRIGELIVLHGLGNVAQQTGDFPAARELYEAALRLSRECGDPAAQCGNLLSLGTIAQETGDPETAERLARQSLALAVEMGSVWQQAYCHEHLGQFASQRGDPDAAAAHFRTGLELVLHLGNRMWGGWFLAKLASISSDRGDLQRAATLWGAAAALRARQGSTDKEGSEDEVLNDRPGVRAALGDEGYQTASSAGAMMTFAEAVTFALARG